MEALFTLIFIAAFIAGAIYIPYKIFKVIFVGENPSGTSSNAPTSNWKCPKCGLINNVAGSTSCFCGYDKNKPEIEKREIRQEDLKSKTPIKQPAYETPKSSNSIEDFDNLTQAALSSALFEKNFEVLGLSPRATIDEVRERCKELVKQWHPDLHKHDPDKHKQASIKIQEIKAAYEAITSDTGIATRTKSQTYSNSLNNNFATEDVVSPQNRTSQPSPKRESKSYAKAWPRFFARMFDLWWESILIGMLSAIVLALIIPNFAVWISKPGSETLFGILIMPIALIFDAALYSLAGNTPGKMLLGLKVTRLGGIPLEFGEYFSRNMSVWFSGLALGLPLINLFTMANQHRRLSKGESASYDYDSNYKVLAQPPSGLRITAFVLLFVCLFFVMVILNAIGKNG